VPEVNPRFEQLLHSDISQLTSSLSLHPDGLNLQANLDCHSRPQATGQGKN
jgi:hypothetical protein